MGPETSVSFIIPTYEDNTRLSKCLESLTTNAVHGFDGPFEIIIVDDGSSAAVQKAVVNLAKSYQCRVVLKTHNESFTMAINSGLRIAQGAYLILVNNDIEFSQPEWLHKMLTLFKTDSKIGIAGCRLLFPDGLIQHAGMGYFPRGKYTFAHFHAGQPANYPPALINKRVIAVTGALLMIRRDLLQEIGFLDESFRLVCSDSDLCLRAHLAGWKVMYGGEAEAIHYEGGTRGNKPHNKIHSFAVIEEEDVENFYERWHSRLAIIAQQIGCL